MTTVETVTILITDLVGSTGLESRVGPVVADELRRDHFGVLREAIEEGDGDEVKNTGDGLMVAFSGASAAVETAVRMQQLMERRNRDAEERLPIKVGLGMGEATHEDDDYFGMPSIMAARLCDKASGGQILAPALIKLMAEQRSEHDFGAVGELELKGISKPVETFEVSWQPLGADATTIPLPPRLVGVPPVSYVGREKETELLSTMWESAAEGKRRVGLVAGEPGIGKTRLVTHAALERHSNGAVVLYGRCEEDLAAPYGPWIETLEHYIEHAPAEVLERHVQRHGGELTRLVPALARRIPDAPAPKETDPETERYMLLGAVLNLLVEASADAPIVLLLDDLHWADKPTLALLKHVVGGSASARLLVLGTYRDSELSRQHPLSDILADLRRESGVERISLGGLEERDVIAILEAAAGHEMDQLGRRLAQQIAGDTSGNPFFVTELLRNLTESGVIVQRRGGRWELQGDPSELGLPQSVREVVGRRIERLGDGTRALLTAAAVIGRDFDTDLLQRIVDQDEDELLDLLEEAVAASVLIEDAERPGAFSFAHALINQTLSEDLGATRRARLHKRVAEALEEVCGGDPGARVAELAHHWATATTVVDLSKAVEYSRRAGQRALDDLAPDEAVRWFEQALELLGQEPVEDSGERCELLIGLGEAQRQVGEPDFRRTLLDASELARETGDRDRLARAAIANNRGFMSTAGLTDDGVLEMLEVAIEQTDESQLERKATLLALLGLELTWSAEPERRKRLCDEALELARRSGDDRTLAVVLWRRFNAITLPDTLGERIAEMDELKTIAERLNDPVLRFWAEVYGSTPAMETGNREAFDARVTALNEIAEELNQPVPNWLANWLEAVREMVSGQLENAERHADEAAQHGSDAGQADALTFYAGQLQQIRWAQGRLDEVLDLLVMASEENPDLSSAHALLAFTLCELGQLDEARALLEPVAVSRFDAVPRDMLWLNTMVAWAEVAAAVEHAEAAEVLYEMLEPWSDQFACISIVMWMPTSHYLGRLGALLGRTEDAERCFERALRLEEGFEAPLFAAATRIGWARLLLGGDSGDAARARELLEQARSSAESLGGAGIAQQAAALLDSVGHAGSDSQPTRADIASA
jgi:class 3 adenylate cyclase/tetratricopeptide (TPR) repeat protein